MTTAPPPDVHGVARMARSYLAAAVTVLLAAFAHELADGTLPSWPALLPVVGIVGMLTHRLADRELAPWEILALLAGAQLAVHVIGTVHGGHTTSDPLLMLTAHLASALVTAVMLANAERIWWRLRAWWQRRHTPALRQQPPAPAAALPLPRFQPVHTTRRAGVVGMRAPPARTA